MTTKSFAVRPSITLPSLSFTVTVWTTNRVAELNVGRCGAWACGVTTKDTKDTTITINAETVERAELRFSAHSAVSALTVVISVIFVRSWFVVSFLIPQSWRLQPAHVDSRCGQTELRAADDRIDGG